MTWEHRYHVLMNTTVRLSALLKLSALPHVLVFQRNGQAAPLPGIDITGIRYDSRSCEPGNIYCAFRGLHVDGRAFISDALERGAVAIVTDTLPEATHDAVPYIVVDLPRRAYSLLCGAFFGNPASGMKIIGVTGTDGKSTTCEYLWQLFRKNGHHAGLLGTVSWDDGSGLAPSPYRQSTPEAWELHAFLASCRAHGVSTVILEATSHALSPEYDRLAGIDFSGALYTTISSEHLEFHGSVERYVDAKLNLARRLLPGAPLVVTYDNTRKTDIVMAAPRARILMTRVRQGEESRKEVHSALRGARGGTDREADIIATIDRMDSGEIFFSCDVHGMEQPVAGRFPAPFHFLLSNALEAAAMTGALCDIPVRDIIPALSALTPARGRAKLVPNTWGVTVLVDFAHTADAFAHVLEDMRNAHPRSGMTIVFGAAGERDPSKRAPMGAQAAKWCERLIITDEDPRNEGYEAILKDIESGIPDAMKKRRTVLHIPDRRKAIREAVNSLQEGDVLLLLGKGHETSIEYENGRKIPWDELKEAQEALSSCAACRGNSHI